MAEDHSFLSGNPVSAGEMREGYRETEMCVR